jgi:hypothetical protein
MKILLSLFLGESSDVLVLLSSLLKCLHNEGRFP